MRTSNPKNIKKFLLRLAIFCLPIIAVSYPLDRYLVSKQRKNGDGEVGVWNDLYSGKINSDVVIYGASRAWQMFDPFMMQDSLHTTVYNLGIDGHNFFLQDLRHQLMRKYNRKPKLIIVSLDFMTLAKRPDLYKFEQFLPFMLWDKNVRDHVNKYEGYSTLDYYLPLMRYYGKSEIINSFLKTKTSEKRLRGYLGWKEPYSTGPFIHKMVIEFDPYTLKLFDNFLNECKQLKIKVIFVYTPEYFDGRDNFVNRNQMFSYFSQYSKKYNLPFFNYVNDSLSYKKKYFWNMEHLNAAGSEIFTHEFIDTLVKTHVLDGVIPASRQ